MVLVNEYGIGSIADIAQDIRDNSDDYFDQGVSDLQDAKNILSDYAGKQLFFKNSL